jgi:uncharacterized protein
VTTNPKVRLFWVSTKKKENLFDLFIKTARLTNGVTSEKQFLDSCFIIQSDATPTSTGTSTSTTGKMTIETDKEWNVLLDQVYNATKEFYKQYSQLIKVSHGLNHVKAVYEHTIEALKCHKDLSVQCQMEIKSASLLHDVDDEKYFPQNNKKYINAIQILQSIHVPSNSIDTIIEMISYVSCSRNGNTVPEKVLQNESYYLLIPRWCDRLEAVGTIGVVRCYQYNREKNEPLWSDLSPRATTIDEVWMYATPERFLQYQTSDKHSSLLSNDMISHYYDKLLHVARPPPNIVRNKYLEQMANESCVDLIEVCIRFGRTGKVDEEHILNLQKMCSR